MSTLDYFANPQQIAEDTLVEMFLRAFDEFEGEAFRYHDGSSWNQISWVDGFHRIKQAAGGLRALGMDRGDRAAILSENRPQWALADYGSLFAGVVDVPIYATLTAEQVAWVLADSGARLVFCADPIQLEKVLKVRDDLPDLDHVVVFDAPADLPTGVLSWDEFLARGADAMADVSDDQFRADARQAQPHDVATILYTSGTTGNPKGVMLTHNNLASNVEASSFALPVTKSDVTLSFLPLSHVFQRMVDYLLLSRGCTIAYARSLQTVSDDMKTVRPTIVVSVPRLYEKVYNKVMEAQGLKKVLVQWAREVGEAKVAEEEQGRELGGLSRLAYGVADRLVFKKLRAGLGGRLRFFVSGGAPLSPDINRFFYSAGVVILEGYGLTETSPVTNVNIPGRVKIGTVGPPVANTEIQIAEDGEILIRGPQVMKGYYKLPEATAKAINEEGWFHTGDIGELDENGYLRITDRKKDIIVTAGGKNIAPQPIENRFKTLGVVDQVVMIGDRRKFPVILVVPSHEVLQAFAAEKGLSGATLADLVAHDACRDYVLDGMREVLDNLASFERPKKVAVLGVPFSIEAGDLTPTQKVRRRVVERRYREFIDSLYADELVDQTLFQAPPPVEDGP